MRANTERYKHIKNKRQLPQRECERRALQAHKKWQLPQCEDEQVFYLQ